MVTPDVEALKKIRRELEERSGGHGGQGNSKKEWHPVPADGHRRGFYREDLDVIGVERVWSGGVRAGQSRLLETRQFNPSVRPQAETRD
jgi:hypothetical protein